MTIWFGIHGRPETGAVHITLTRMLTTWGGPFLWSEAAMVRQLFLGRFFPYVWELPDVSASETPEGHAEKRA